MMGQLNRHKHNSIFSVSQRGMMSFPQTTGVKADDMKQNQLWKYKSTECDSVENYKNQNYINPNIIRLSLSLH